MNLPNLIRPVNKHHSIKEAVITIFLSSKIENPASFKELLNNEFRNKFNFFEVVDSWSVSLQPGKEDDNPEYSKNTNVGFRFNLTDGDELQRVLQGMNEENRVFLSYHILNYVRWAPFFSDFLDCITTIAQKHQEFQIEAISLNYIDEFVWIASGEPDLRIIFSDQSEFLPSSFFNNLLPRLDLFFTVNRSNEVTGTIYYDRINIAVLPTIEPTINITHTVTHQLNEPINIKDLLNRLTFKELIESAHYHNKKILKGLLTPEMAQIINLT